MTYTVRYALANKPGCTIDVPMRAALGHLALHVGGPSSWTITHRPTGYAVLQEISSYQAGLRALAVLNQPHVDWSSETLRNHVGDEHIAARDRAWEAVVAMVAT